ncbi:MAG: hypothetical protein R3D03_01470 [Geminicoccaceae bacterium]
MELVDLVLYVIRWKRPRWWQVTLSRKCDHAVPTSGAVIITQVDIERHAQYGYGGIDAYYSKYTGHYVN